MAVSKTVKDDSLLQTQGGGGTGIKEMTVDGPKWRKSPIGEEEKQLKEKNRKAQLILGEERKRPTEEERKIRLPLVIRDGLSDADITEKIEKDRGK
ncbi:hypothetical protein NDU88_004118 [Pleurodeles waltl]|uniref:Uncharacterized protein n=1 Tax=Pleurodeles waltl TaxID=8319 RepID=A0AAV7VHY3_PLEWA|nr:hypothetical protein NDU88_004118 [Pleurodeles waltl]